MKLTVEKRHIDLGIPQTCDRCPIALAAKESLGRYVWVDHGTLHVYPTTERPANLEEWDAAWDLPEKAVDFYKRFDDHMDVAPFDFEMTESPAEPF